MVDFQFSCLDDDDSGSSTPPPSTSSKTGGMLLSLPEVGGRREAFQRGGEAASGCCRSRENTD